MHVLDRISVLILYKEVNCCTWCFPQRFQYTPSWRLITAGKKKVRKWGWGTTEASPHPLPQNKRLLKNQSASHFCTEDVQLTLQRVKAFLFYLSSPLSCLLDPFQAWHAMTHVQQCPSSLCTLNGEVSEDFGQRWFLAEEDPCGCSDLHSRQRCGSRAR